MKLKVDKKIQSIPRKNLVNVRSLVTTTYSLAVDRLSRTSLSTIISHIQGGPRNQTIFRSLQFLYDDVCQHSKCSALSGVRTVL